MLQGQYNGHWLAVHGIIEIGNIGTWAEFVLIWRPTFITTLSIISLVLPSLPSFILLWIIT